MTMCDIAITGPFIEEAGELSRDLCSEWHCSDFNDEEAIYRDEKEMK